MSVQQQEINLRREILAAAEAELQRRLEAAREACAAAGVNPDHAPFVFDDNKLVITSAAKPD